jgi:hypothetical protein
VVESIKTARARHVVGSAEDSILLVFNGWVPPPKLWSCCLQRTPTLEVETPSVVLALALVAVTCCCFAACLPNLRALFMHPIQSDPLRAKPQVMNMPLSRSKCNSSSSKLFSRLLLLFGCLDLGPLSLPSPALSYKIRNIVVALFKTL